MGIQTFSHLRRKSTVRNKSVAGWETLKSVIGSHQYSTFNQQKLTQKALKTSTFTFQVSKKLLSYVNSLLWKISKSWQVVLPPKYAVSISIIIGISNTGPVLIGTSTSTSGIGLIPEFVLSYSINCDHNLQTSGPKNK